MRRKILGLTVLVALGVTATIASFGEPERPVMVARTSEPLTHEEIVGEFNKVLAKSDRLPIMGRPVKTETILIPVEHLSYDEFVARRRTKGIPTDRFH